MAFPFLRRYRQGLWGRTRLLRDGHITRMDYDGHGNLADVVTPDGAKTQFAYDAQGRLTSITDPLGAATLYTYDAQGNLIQTTDPLGNVQHSRYDDANRLIADIDALGRTTKYAYDALDRLVSQADPLGGVTRYSYDTMGHRLTTTDAFGHAQETLAYDALGRVIRRPDALGHSETWGSDADGHPIRHTDRNGHTTDYAYDPLGRLVSRVDADGRYTLYSYDLADRLVRIRDSQTGDILIDYDPLDRPTRILSDQGQVEYQYDAEGRRTKRILNGTDETDYSYDLAGRVTEIAQGSDRVQFSYDADGRLQDKTLPNGIIQHYSYDADGRLTGIETRKPDGSVLDQTAYTYDADGERIKRVGTQGSTPETPFTAQYDAGNRLTRITFKTSGETWDLAYDADGHLISKTRQSDGAQTTYTWDARGHLAAIDGPDGHASFEYDALGRRISKTVNGQTTGYLYDGQQAVAELQGNKIGALYLTGLDIDAALARVTPNGTRSQITDALGSVVAETDEQGNVTSSYAYSPYGETKVGGETDNAVRYTAREEDGTGLYYYRARYYDPRLKRFISEDPIGLLGGIDVFAYVGGGPIMRKDSFGLDSFLFVPYPGWKPPYAPPALKWCCDPSKMGHCAFIAGAVGFATAACLDASGGNLEVGAACGGAGVKWLKLEECYMKACHLVPVGHKCCP